MQNASGLLKKIVTPKILHPVSPYTDIVLLTASLTVPWNTGQMLHTNISVYQPKKRQWTKQEMR